MCYRKPGPRCSAHAKKELMAAQATWKAEYSDETFAALVKAEEAYFATPSGWKYLESRYEQDNDERFLKLLEEGKDRRAHQLQLLGLAADEDKPCITTASTMIQQSLATSLGDESLPKPAWWDEYRSATESNPTPLLAITPELLAVLDTPHGKVAVSWEERSQFEGDRDIIMNSGYHIRALVMRDFETGEQVGYLRSTMMDEASMKQSFGVDEFDVFRYYSRKKGMGCPVPSPEEIQNADEETLRQVRRKAWLAARQDRDLGGPLKLSDGTHIERYQLTENHIPDDVVVKKDLDALAKRIRKMMNDDLKWAKEPFVDYSRVSDTYQGMGYGTAMYILTARKLATQGRVLTASGVQSDEAQATWQRMKRNFPNNVKFIKKSNSREYAALDFTN